VVARQCASLVCVRGVCARNCPPTHEISKPVPAGCKCSMHSTPEEGMVLLSYVAVACHVGAEGIGKSRQRQQRPVQRMLQFLL